MKSKKSPADVPPSTREFYLVVTRVGVFCSVNDNGDSVIPWIMVLLDHPRAMIHYTGQLAYMTPPRDDDLRELNRYLPSGSTLYCIPELVDSVRRVVSSSTVVAKKLEQSPPRIQEYVTSIKRDLRASMHTPCVCETSTNYHVPPSWLRLCGRCKSFMQVPGMSEPFLRSLLLTAQRFWRAKPWLRLRMNHCFYIDDGGSSGFHFAQILGKCIDITSY